MKNFISQINEEFIKKRNHSSNHERASKSSPCRLSSCAVISQEPPHGINSKDPLKGFVFDNDNKTFYKDVLGNDGKLHKLSIGKYFSLQNNGFIKKNDEGAEVWKAFVVNPTIIESISQETTKQKTVIDLVEEKEAARLKRKRWKEEQKQREISSYDPQLTFLKMQEKKDKNWARRNSTKRHKIRFCWIGGGKFVIVEDKLQLMKERKAKCPGMGWLNRVGDVCGHVLKEKVCKQTCGLRCCNDPYCVEHKQLHARLRLENFGIKSKTLFHYVLGFPWEDITKEGIRKKWKVGKDWFKIMKKLSPKGGENWGKALYVFDLERRPNNKIYPHFHVGNLPVGNVVEFQKMAHAVSKIIEEKHGVKIVFEVKGYRPIKSLFNYFAKRISGQFGHKSKGTEDSFASLMSDEQYFDIFYGSPHLRSSLGWPASKLANSLVKSVFNDPPTCPICGVTTLFSNRLSDDLNNEFPP